MGKTRKKTKAKYDDLIEQFINDPNYKVLENGEVWSLIQRTGKKSATGQWRLLNTTGNSGKGEWYTYREVNYHHRRLQLHRIMYRQFKGKLDSNKVINHIDGDPSNNSLENLELVSIADNNLHAFRVLGRKPNRSSAKIPDKFIFKIRADRANGMSYKEIIKKYEKTVSLSKSVLSYICSGKTYPEHLLKK